MEDLLQVAEVKITYSSKIKPSKRTKISNPEECVSLFRAFYKDDYEYREKFYVAYLNRANKVIGVKLLSTGSDAATIVSVKSIMQGAILAHACGLVLCHNHPSGNLQASQHDITITKKIKEAALLFDIVLMDHLILTEESFLSFANEGII